MVQKDSVFWGNSAAFFLTIFPIVLNWQFEEHLNECLLGNFWIEELKSVRSMCLSKLLKTETYWFGNLRGRKGKAVCEWRYEKYIGMVGSVRNFYWW